MADDGLAGKVARLEAELENARRAKAEQAAEQAAAAVEAAVVARRLLSEFVVMASQRRAVKTYSSVTREAVRTGVFGRGPVRYELRITGSIRGWLVRNYRWPGGTDSFGYDYSLIVDEQGRLWAGRWVGDQGQTSIRGEVTDFYFGRRFPPQVKSRVYVSFGNEGYWGDEALEDVLARSLAGQDGYV